MSSTEIERRRVNTQTTGQVSVSQQELTLDDLKEFCHLADAHGVEGSTPVVVKEAQVHNGQSYVRETMMSVPAPVVFAYGSSAPPAKHPRTLRRQRTFKYAGVGLGAALLMLPVLMLVLDLLWKLFHFALDWL